MKPMKIFFCLLLVAVFSGAVLLVACCEEDDDDDDAAGGLTITSSAFGEGETISVQYTCDNEDNPLGLNPPLSWTGVPAGTEYFALTCIDPDANDTVHWAVVNIPGSATGMDEGASPDDMYEEATELPAYTGDFSYAGPCPPKDHDAHHYVFTLYALDSDVALPGTADAGLDDVINGILNATIESASLTGLYDRE